MTKKVNIIIVYNPNKTHVLMCYRTKDPYKGLYNFVGGKLELGEGNFEAAYRELYEETAISSADIELIHLFTTQYYVDDIELQVFYGFLNDNVTLVSEKHPLEWIQLEGEDFSKDSKFAGQGNIKHMLDIINVSKQRVGLIDTETTF